MAETVSKSKTNTSPSQRTPVKREAPTTPSLVVKYWKRMRINKVYPVVVRFAGEVEGDPITVRLVMAGAQVVPAEHAMDPGNAGETATFYVTPIANGSLRGEKLEVIQGGRKIQEIRMPSRVTSQKSTLVWLFLALFIPWLLLHYLEYSPIGYHNPVKNDGTESYVRRPWKAYKTYKPGTDELLPDRPSQQITHFIQDNTLDIKELTGLDPKTDTIAKFYDNAQKFPEEAYLNLFENYHAWKLPLPLILFLVFLFMAFVSFLARTQATRKVYGKPLPV
jgi:hypothetical protein